MFICHLFYLFVIYNFLSLLYRLYGNKVYKINNITISGKRLISELIYEHSLHGPIKENSHNFKESKIHANLRDDIRYIRIVSGRCKRLCQHTS